jgi:hypothetical protein
MAIPGLGVQFSHDDEETTQMNHGWVRIISPDDEVIAESDDFQHNRKYREREINAEALAAAVAEAFPTFVKS